MVYKKESVAKVFSQFSRLSLWVSSEKDTENTSGGISWE